MATFGAVIALINEVFTLGWKAYSLFKEAQRKGWIERGRALSISISEAKTDEERSALARRLFEHRVG